MNLFRQLLRLPLPWFEKRHVGDVVSRFGSTKPISDILSQGLISTFVDGVMAIVTLTVMFVYSPTVSLIACASVALTTALRFGFFSSLRIANVSLLSANARESSAFIETIRGIATIKSFGEEANRQRLWQQKKADAANAEIKTGRLNAAFSAGQDLVSGIERVLFVYIAIRYAIQGMLSLGMIFALQAYRQQFLTCSLNVIQQAVSFRLLDMHLGRIADIALSPAEPVSQPFALEGDVAGATPASIELRNVRFPVEEGPTGHTVESRAILSGQFEGASGKRSRISPRQRCTVRAQFLGYDTTARFGHRGKAPVSELHKKCGFTAAGAAGKDHVAGSTVHHANRPWKSCQTFGCATALLVIAAVLPAP